MVYKILDGYDVENNNLAECGNIAKGDVNGLKEAMAPLLRSQYLNPQTVEDKKATQKNADDITVLLKKQIPTDAAKLLKHLGIDVKDDSGKIITGSISSITEDHALRMLQNVTLPNQNGLDTNQITSRMKLEYLMRGRENDFSPETKPIVTWFNENEIPFSVIRKENLTVGCEGAAEAIHIPLANEVKTMFFAVTMGEKKHFIAFHMRGDEEIDPAQLKKTFSNDPVIQALDLDKHQGEPDEVGLTTGRFSPFSLHNAARSGNIKIRQIFSETLTKQPSGIIGTPELFTNAASNFLRVSFSYKKIPVIIEKLGAERVHFSRVKEVNNYRATYYQRNIACVGYGHATFSDRIATAIDDVLSKWAGNIPTFIPDMVGSAKKTDFLNLRETAPQHSEDLGNLLVEQYHDATHGRAADHIFIGHVAATSQPLREAQERNPIAPDKISHIDRITVESIKEKITAGTIAENAPIQVICGKSLKNGWNSSAYSEISQKPQEIDSKAQQLINNVETYSRILSPKLKGALDGVADVINELSIKPGTVLVIGSADLETALVLRDKDIVNTYKKKGIDLVLPCATVAENYCKKAYPDLYRMHMANQEKKLVRETERRAAAALKPKSLLESSGSAMGHGHGDRISHHPTPSHSL